MTVYENYNVIAFKSCIQKFTVYIKIKIIKKDKTIGLNLEDRIVLLF